MKKHDPRIVRGIQAEKRFIQIARSLKEEMPITWLGKVKKTGTKLDSAGIDVTVFVKHSGGRTLKVPFQIKSSWHYAEVFSERHPECVSLGIPVVVVNDAQPDHIIRYRIMNELKVVWETGKDFDLLYDAVRNRPLDQVSLPRPRFIRDRLLTRAVLKEQRRECC